MTARPRRPNLPLFNFALFAAVTVWTGLSDPRLTPGFAALAIAQGLLALLVLQRRAPSAALVILGFLGASYFGLAYFVASTVGAPNTSRFWITFMAVAAIFAPVVLLAWQRRATWVTRTRASSGGSSGRQS